MDSYTLTSLVTNQYEARASDLCLKRCKIPTIYVVVLNGAVPLAPAYPEGYLSVDLLTIDHLVWSGHERVHIQCSSNRRFFELCFTEATEAAAFVASLKSLEADALLEQRRTALEMDIISMSWPIGRLNASTLQTEPLANCSLMSASSESATDGYLVATPMISPLDVSKTSCRIKLLVKEPTSPGPQDTKIANEAVKQCHSCEETLGYMLSTGRYSDLTIVAGARSFRVHKAIVCTRSQFFARALSGTFSEAECDIVTVNDAAEVIEAILQYIYGQEITLCRPLLATSFTGQKDTKRIDLVKLTIDVYVAADKYGILMLQDIIVQAVKERLPWLCKPQSLLALGDYIYSVTPYRDGQICAMREAIAEFMQDHLKAILQDPNGATAMLENQSLMFDILQRSAEIRPTPNKLTASVKRVREEAFEEAKEECRRSDRLRQKRMAGDCTLGLRSSQA